MTALPQIPIAIICNSVPPYRLHQHLRVAREIPEIRLSTIRDHGEDVRWNSIADADDINLVEFGQQVSCWEQGHPRHARREWGTAGEIIRWLQRENVRVVILSGYNDLGRVRIARWCRRHRVPCFVTGDSNIADEAGMNACKQLVKRLVLRRVFSWFTGALPFGTRGEAFYNKYGVPSSRIFFFPLEPDYDLIKGIDTAQVSETLQRFGLARGRRRLVYSGRLVRAKRVDLLLDAFAAIAPERPDWDLVVIGDGALAGELRARVSAALQDRVFWLGHLRSQVDVSALYRGSEVLVLPSEFEPWALVVNEAVAAGMAVVSSPIPGASAELVRDGLNGRIFRTGDAADLARCLRDATDEAQLTQMRTASAEVLEHWRRRGDLVVGLRSALRWSGVLN